MGERCSPTAAIIVLSVIMVFGAFYTYFFYSWFPKYLNASRGVENVEAGNLTSLVMAGSAVGMLLGGWLADRISAVATTRSALGATSASACYSIAAACLFLGVRQDDPLALAACGARRSARCTSRCRTGGRWRSRRPAGTRRPSSG